MSTPDGNDVSTHADAEVGHRARLLLDKEVRVDADATAGRIAQWARLAEENGWDGISLGEVNHDPLVILASAAAETARVRLRSGVSVAFARSPMATAYTARDLQTLAGGRFELGLGTQVKAHITRRFSMPWSSPAKRMREYVAALDAVWSTWESGSELRFDGEFYQFDLMPDAFRPPSSPWGRPRISLGAVGPLMTEVAADVGDGLLAHGLTSVRYLREVTLPATARRRSTSSVRPFEISCIPMAVTGRDPREREAAEEQARRAIAFYASTPAYRAVLDLHGWGSVHEQLLELSRRQAWAAMGRIIDDEMLHTFAVVGDPGEVGAELVRRFEGLVDRVTLHAPGADDETLDAVMAAAATAR